MDLSTVSAGDSIRYTGSSFKFDDGTYTVVSAESTYEPASACPEDARGKLLIIEFMNDGTPMFFFLDQLNPHEWELGEK
ncbi:hypothetical protein ACFQPF_05460 [Fictibacillus iocasae]|uniref:Uncharacterized protein n=1 Tax=Fictibacillus iocasae TaxID=2715437 RepID=A0ABW2NKC4_9BACL